MLIVTQAGEIVNFDRMESVFVEDDHPDGRRKIVALGGSGNYATLGWYKNQEQAEAVMQEIVENYETPFRVRAYKMP